MFVIPSITPATPFRATAFNLIFLSSISTLLQPTPHIQTNLRPLPHRQPSMPGLLISSPPSTLRPQILPINRTALDRLESQTLQTLSIPSAQHTLGATLIPTFDIFTPLLRHGPWLRDPGEVRSSTLESLSSQIHHKRAQTISLPRRTRPIVVVAVMSSQPVALRSEFLNIHVWWIPLERQSPSRYTLHC